VEDSWSGAVVVGIFLNISSKSSPFSLNKGIAKGMLLSPNSFSRYDLEVSFILGKLVNFCDIRSPSEGVVFDF